jgi:LCP family protein required for cell wall assembly
VRGKGVAWLVALLLFVVGFVGRGVVSGGLVAGGAIAGNPRFSHNPNADRTPASFTVLLLGIDNRARQVSIERTDTIMVVHVNTRTGRVSLMSVPRDTMVDVVGHGVQKINSVAEFEGGPMATVDAVNRLLGTNIQYWVLTNFSGFQSVIDALGCVNIDVPTVMNYNASDVHIHLEPGVQCLNGTQALDFVRWRETALGDIARTKDQQMLIKAVAHRLLTPGGLARLPLVLPAMGRAVQTNLPGRDILTLIRIAHTMGDKSHPELSETLPGYYLTYQGLSYWFVIPQNAVRAYGDLIRGRLWPGQPFDPAAVTATQTGTWTRYPLIQAGPAGQS